MIWAPLESRCAYMMDIRWRLGHQDRSAHHNIIQKRCYIVIQGFTIRDHKQIRQTRVEVKLTDPENILIISLNCDNKSADASHRSRRMRYPRDGIFRYLEDVRVCTVVDVA